MPVPVVSSWFRNGNPTARRNSSPRTASPPWVRPSPVPSPPGSPIPINPWVAFTGDGGFYLAVAELQTAAVEKLPIIVLVFDDSEISLIRVKQEVKGFPRFGVDMGGTDWVKMAQGFGADGYVADNEHALGDALKAALKSKRSSVVVAKIDSSCYLEQFNALREV